MPEPMSNERRVSTSPIRDEATGLETLCAFLHAAGSADSNVIKDVAWRTFNLIRAWREQGAEVERLRAELDTVLRNYETLQGRALTLEGERDEAQRERDLAVAHDRQPYPTAWAYEQACRALEEHRQRADKAEAERDAAREQVKRVRDLHTPKTIETADEDTGETARITVCVECDGHRERLNDDADPILHPCATVRDLDGARRPR